MLFRDLSIRHKLMLMMLASTLLVLLLSNGAFIANALLDTKDELRSKLTPLAVVLGSQATAALTFNDPKAARDDLGALEAEPGVVAAYLYDAHGHLFAAYIASGVENSHALSSQRPLSPDALGAKGQLYFDNEYAHLRMPIVLRGERLGVIHLVDDQRQVQRKLHENLLISAVIVGLALGFAVLLAVRLPGIVSEPLQRLTALMKRVSADSDYSLRGRRDSGDEIGELVDGFNEMLAEVEKRDRALASHSEDLEWQVSVRTRELQEAKQTAGNRLPPS